MAPYLLLGFLCAALLGVLVPEGWVMRHLGGRGGGAILKATLAGVPLPLCSCGVIPVAAGLKARGGSPGAVAAFTAATPQTGVDSIAATWGLLGPVFASIRVIVALLSGWLAGLLVSLFADGKSATGDAPAAPTTDASLRMTWPEGLRFGLLTLPKDLAVAMILGIAVAAALTTFVPAGFFEPYLGYPILGYLAVTLLAAPLYVCSTGSIPLAVGLLHAGASPGTALLFLIAGPATNMATIFAMFRLLGRQATVLYLIATIGAGWAAAFVFDAFGGQFLGQLSHHHEMEHVVWWKTLAGILMAGLIVGGFLSARKKQASCCAETSTPSCCGSTATEDELKPSESACCQGQTPAKSYGCREH